MKTIRKFLPILLACAVFLVLTMVDKGINVKEPLFFKIAVAVIMGIMSSICYAAGRYTEEK